MKSKLKIFKTKSINYIKIKLTIENRKIKAHLKYSKNYKII